MVRMGDISELPSSRSEAINTGATHYLTGKVCVHGHIAKRSTKSRECSECKVIRMRNARMANPERAREIWRASLKKNKDAANKRKVAAYHSNIESSRRKQRERRKNNPEKFKEYDAKHRRNSGVRLHRAISEGVRRSLFGGGKAGRRAFDILGYSREHLMAHLKSNFQPGMSWDNYGKHGWEVDHIIPRDAFNFQTVDDIDFKKCWELKNLQPLWNLENKSKGAKLMKPFQPSLALAIPANDNAPAAPTSVGAA